MNLEIKIFWHFPEKEITDRATNKIRDATFAVNGFSDIDNDVPSSAKRRVNGVAPASNIRMS